MLFDWDYQKDTIEFSGTWEKLFGFAPIEDNVRLHLASGTFLHPDDAALLEQHIANMENGSDYEMVEVRIATTGGRYLWCRFRGTASFNQDGVATHLLGIIVNIDGKICMADPIFEKKKKNRYFN